MMTPKQDPTLDGLLDENGNLNQKRLNVEIAKLMAETFKLTAEGRKFDRERWVTTIASIAALVTALAALIKAYQ